MKRYLFLILLPLTNFASHIGAAYISMDCLGVFGSEMLYEVKVTEYRLCTHANTDPNGHLAVSNYWDWEQYSPFALGDPNCVRRTAVLDSIEGNIDITPECYPGCDNGSHQFPAHDKFTFSVLWFIDTACLDLYTAAFLGSRSQDFTNVCCQGGSFVGLDNNVVSRLRYKYFGYPKCNDSPIVDDPIMYVCKGDSFCFELNATDPDGDSLVVEFIGPSGVQAPWTIDGFAWDIPVKRAVGAYITRDINTGNWCSVAHPTYPTSGTPQINLFAYNIQEWRDGVKIAVSTVEANIIVYDCITYGGQIQWR